MRPNESNVSGENIRPLDTVSRIKSLVRILNHHRQCYYENDRPEISDAEYDALFDELANLEIQTGLVYPDSPTQSVGFPVQNSLRKVKHNHLMLSLDKSKDFQDIVDWAKCCDLVGMLKLDGNTISLEYDENGDLIRAETRGDGQTGELVTENVKMISNVPLHVDTRGEPMTVDGECVVCKDVFERKNKDDEFSHPRNYAAGAIRQLDTSITKERELTFVAWNLIRGAGKTNSFDKNLFLLEELGFEVTPHFLIPDSIYTGENFIKNFGDDMKGMAQIWGYPIDGLVFALDDVEYGLGLGLTGHHFNHSRAFKWENEVVPTTLREIRWDVGKSGQVTPVAIFDPVDLGGAVASRSALHNLTYIQTLGIDVGSRIGVIRANEVIPRVEKNLGERRMYQDAPQRCPSCGEPLEYRSSSTMLYGKGGEAEMSTQGPVLLYCNNPNCPAKNLARFVQFVSRQGMNIEGLSEATLEKLIDEGYVKTFEDIYRLDRYKDEIIGLEGFGEKSWDKLWKGIQKSRDCKLENFLVALSIPLIGKTAARTISKHFKGNYQDLINAGALGFDFTQLEDFGEKMNESMHNWLGDYDRIKSLEGSNLAQLLRFEDEKTSEAVDESNFCFGKTFVVTGKFSQPRSYYEELITSRGGKLTGSVSKKTDYLLTDDPNSGSSKAVKARELGIPVLSEVEFMAKVGE